MLHENRIAIVNSSSFGRIFPDHLARLEKLGTVERFTFDSEIDGISLAEKLHGYSIIVSSVTPFFDRSFFDHKDELLLISRHGIGYNNIDLEAAADHDTVVTIVPALVERDAVAENNVTNLLNVMRQTRQSDSAVHAGRWVERAKFVGNNLSNKTAGVIGVGNIGSRVAEILHYGYRCHVLGCDPNLDELELGRFGARKVTLEGLLAQSDVICVCPSLNEENYHMLSKAQFELMKDKVYISNAARGALIDEEAMTDALKNGKVAGFATDVLEVEPGEKNHPYLAFPNVIVTPHTSAYTMECLEGMGEKCVADCESIVKGELPQRAVQPVSRFLKAEEVVLK